MIEKLNITGGAYFSNLEIAKVFEKDSANEFDLMRIQNEIHEETGRTAKIENDGIRILDHSEASEYNHYLFGRHIAGMQKRHWLMTKVDRSELSDEMNKSHDRKIEIQSKVMQSLKTTLKKYTPIRVDSREKRRLPKIL